MTRRELRPEDVPKSSLSPLSQRYLQWKFGTAVAGVFTVLVLINLFTGGPNVTGRAIQEEASVTSSLFGISFVLLVVSLVVMLIVFELIAARKAKK